MSNLTCGNVGFPGGSVVKSLPAVQEMGVQSLGGEDLLEKKMQPTPVFLPGKSLNRGAWWAAVHRVTKELDAA